jgi:ubiquinone/menaquinone biosynthesis C-methylase UbiE
MTSTVSNSIWNILTCSHCSGALRETDSGAKCLNCGLEYQYTPSNSLDLRLRKHKKYGVEVDIGDALLSEKNFQFEPLKENVKPEVDFSNVSIPWHLKKELLSYFPKAKLANSLMLDLGCGSSIHKNVCEHAGFEWVGLDHDSSNALILGDAHSLPFKSDSFEFILSIAVLEHIRFPFVMMREACRVLKPGGKFIGTVAFLEPFHGNSFYHHTHLGTFNSLQDGGFEVEKVAPSEEWSVLVAQASMGLFPKMPSFISQSIVYPIQLLHRLWWFAGSFATPKSNNYHRVINTTGAFTFIATKPTKDNL